MRDFTLNRHTGGLFDRSPERAKRRNDTQGATMTAAMQYAGLAGLLALTADSNPCFRREKAISFRVHHSPRHAQAHRSRWRGNLLPATYMYPVIRRQIAQDHKYLELRHNSRWRA